MSFDLEDILRAAGADPSAPRLVLVSQLVEHGTPTTAAYFWSSGRVQATVGPGWVRIRRRLGNVGMFSGPGGNNLRLDVRDLQALERACQDWARSRDGWAAFFHSSAGYPGGYGGGCYYQAPGARGEVVTIGTSTMGGRRGGELCGQDEVVTLDRPRGLGDTTAIVAEIWRRGERFGPAEGSLVGLRYRLGAGVFVDAQRRDARVWREDGEVVLEADEVEFVAELLLVARRTQQQPTK